MSSIQGRIKAVILSIGVLLVALPGIAMAQKEPRSQESRFSGDVRGEIRRCGVGLPLGTVFAAGTSFISRTDSNGRFYLSYLQPGGYSLTVEDNSGALVLQIPDVTVINSRITDVGVQSFCPDRDNDGFTESQDCNDNNPQVNPGSIEACNGLDDNCDGTVDEQCPNCSDDDNDGFFAQGGSCGTLDCNDTDSGINPAVQEVCSDQVDNNCNGQVDEECLTCTPGASCSTGSVGVCSTGAYTTGCVCQSIVQPSAEVCDSQDNNCDGQVDEDNVCATYNWIAGAYSMCSVICGGGVQTRAVNCVDASTGAVVADYFCIGTVKPSTTQSCNTQPCSSYTWVTGAYGACSVLCGGGVQTRTVSCVDTSTGAVVADLFCSGTVKPSMSQSCNAQACGG